MTTPATPDPTGAPGDIVTSTVALCPAATAFALWTEGIGTWWPRARTIGGERVAEIVAEPVAGGRVFERWDDGSIHEWAAVVAVDAPRSIRLAWCRHEGAGTTDLLIEFLAEGPIATRVRITHGGWDALADPAAERARYQPGPGALWGAAFAEFGDHTLDPAVHRFFAVRANNRTWSHLDPFDAEAALHLAHTAAYHWGEIGGPEHRARAAWLVSRCYATAGWAEPARFFAERTMALCAGHGLADFDLAYAHEALARAAAAAGDLTTARHHRDQAAAVPIDDDDDREILESDLACEPWFGLTA